MMPDSMIERVARALLVADRSAITPDYYQRMARAAIEAMREPTEAMLDAGVNFRERNARTEQIWQAMIDAALKEKQ
jgi:hypothetical protein